MKARTTITLPGKGVAAGLFRCLLAAACCVPPATALCQESVVYSYDTRGRLIQAHHASGPAFRFAYDAAGNIVTIQQSAHSEWPGDFPPGGPVPARGISGTLLGATGTPFATPVTLKAYSGTSCGDLQLQATTRSEAGSGAYAFANLADESYYILADPAGTDFLPAWYAGDGNAVHCPQAQAVSLSDQPVVTGRDIRLNRAASIAGTVLEGGGAVPGGAEGISVRLYADDGCTGPLVKTAAIDPADGRFAIPGLGAGTYYLQADTGGSGYQRAWWASGGVAPHCSNAEAVVVADGALTDAIEIRLERGGSIGGTVFKSDGTSVVSGEVIVVEAFAAGRCDREPVASALANETTGVYVISGLKPGAYCLRAKTPGAAYVEEWWSATGNAFSILQAGSINLSAPEPMTDVHFRLDPGGTISGTVLEADGQTRPKGPVTVQFHLYQSNLTGACGTALVTSVQTAADGSYRQPLPAGRYFLRVEPAAEPYAIAWWNPADDARSCQGASYTDVKAGDAVTGRDFKLRPAIAVSGHIFERDGVTPIPAPIRVIAYSDDPCQLREVARGAYDPVSGRYTIRNLADIPHAIRVDAEGTPYADGWWSATGSAFFCFQATHVQPENGQEISGRDILLERGGTITGKVYRKDGLTPVDQAVPIGLYPDSACGGSRKVTTSLSDPVSGEYSFTRQGPGNYALLADPASGSAYIDEWWSQAGDAFTCQHAELIALPPGGAQTGRDFNLDTQSTLSGTLYKTDGSTMNINFTVRLYTAGACGGTQVATATSSRTTGRFVFQNITPGRYHLLADTGFNLYAAEWYSRSGDAFACADASEIVVPSGEEIANLDVRLDVGGKVSGALFREDGTTKITETTAIRLYQGDPCNPQYVTYANSNSQGVYEIDALPPGTYYLMTSTAYYFDRWWSPSGNAQSCRDARPIVITGVGGVSPATDFRLRIKGSLSGRVYQLDGKTPVAGTMRLYLYRTFPPCQAAAVSTATASADGSYAFRGLDPGTYSVLAYYTYGNYVSEWWSAAGDAFYCNQAEGITLADAEQKSGIDFRLHENGSISGRILRYSGAPIDSETIYVYAYSGESACGATYKGNATAGGTDGGYSLTRLTPGTYFLQTASASLEGSAFIPEWWSERGHTYDCSDAEPVPVVMDRTVSDRNFALYDCSNFPERAANDRHADAAVLPGNSGSHKTHNFCASAESGEPDHAGLGDGAKSSLWWRWTAPTGGRVVFKTEGSAFDTVLAVYTGSAVDALTPAAQNDNADGSLWSRVSFDAIGGQTYLIAVDTADGWPGVVTLGYEQQPAVAGDLDGDGSIDLRDAVFALQLLTRGTDAAPDSGGDLNADGRIGTAEAIFILQKLARLR